MEYKAVGLDVKAEGDQGIYEGYFAVFDNIDDGLDVIHQGAFVKTLEERAGRIKVLYAHNWDKLIGPSPDILQEDEKGLFARGHLTLGTFWGNEVWALMKDGALTEGSIGYRVKDYKYSENSVRHLYTLGLYEISPVALAMNPLAELSAVKAALGRFEAQDTTTSLAEQVKQLTAMVEELKEGRLLVTASEAQREEVVDGVEGVVDALLEGKRGLLARRLRVVELALRL
jgi:uncharacterized protein